MYKLVLTKDDREAIDWVGGRYSTGNDLRNILTTCYEGEWGEQGDIIFDIPEYKAWVIAELINDETDEGRTSIPGFDRLLSEKLWKFVDQIV